MYKIKKKAGDWKDAVIEKTFEQKSEFTFNQIERHETDLKKKFNEVSAQVNLEAAKMQNIENNHKFVKKLTPEQIVTVRVYAEAAENLSKYTDYRDKIRKTLGNYKKEKRALIAEFAPKDE